MSTTRAIAVWLALAVILDSQFKIMLAEYYYSQIYGSIALDQIKEGFGLVLCVETTNTEEEALDLTTDIHYGLGSAIISNELFLKQAMISPSFCNTLELWYLTELVVTTRSLEINT